MTYHLETLPNHLRIATYTMPHAQSVSIAVSVGVGARYEQPHQGGIAHFLEHMAFKGTKTRTARDIAEAFDAMGAQANAYTSQETTVYYVRCLPQDVTNVLALLADIVQHSAFAADEIARERDVILQEIAMTRDTPEDRVYDLYQALAYKNAALGRPILGTSDTVCAFKAQDFEQFVQQHYTTANIVITAAGQVDAPRFTAQAAVAFADLPTASHPATAEAAIFGADSGTEVEDFEQVHIMLGRPCAHLHSPYYYPTQLATMALGGGMSSRLFQEIREKRGLVYHISASVGAHPDTGNMQIYAACAADKVQELLEVTRHELQILPEQLTQIELDRAKRQWIAGMRMSCDSTSSMAEWMGRHILLYGEYRNADIMQAEVERVTLRNVQEVAAHWVADANKEVLAMVGPL